MTACNSSAMPLAFYPFSTFVSGIPKGSSERSLSQESFPFLLQKKKCNDPFGFANEKRSSETTGCYTEDGEKNIGEEKRHPKYRD